MDSQQQHRLREIQLSDGQWVLRAMDGKTVSGGFRGGKMAAPSVDKPMCPNDDIEMVYDQEQALWTCPVYKCDKKMRRSFNFADAKGQVLSGEFHLYALGDPGKEKFYLYIRQLSVFIDITEVVLRDSSGKLHGQDDYHLGLMFPTLNTPEVN